MTHHTIIVIPSIEELSLLSPLASLCRFLPQTWAHPSHLPPSWTWRVCAALRLKGNCFPMCARECLACTQTHKGSVILSLHRPPNSPLSLKQKSDHSSTALSSAELRSSSSALCMVRTHTHTCLHTHTCRPVTGEFLCVLVSSFTFSFSHRFSSLLEDFLF